MDLNEIYELTKVHSSREELLNNKQEELINLLLQFSSLIEIDEIFFNPSNSIKYNEINELVPILNKFILTARNLCCGNELSIDILIKSNFFNNIFKLIKWLAINGKASDQDNKSGSLDIPELMKDSDYYNENYVVNKKIIAINNDLKSKLILYICQFLSNSTATSYKASDFILSQKNMIDGISDLLAICINFSSSSKSLPNIVSRKPLAAAWSLIYNMICKSKNQSSKRFEILIQRRDILCQLFLSLHIPSSNHEADQNNVDPVSDWAQLFGIQIIEQNLISKIFLILESKVNHEFKLINTEQVSNLFFFEFNFSFNFIINIILYY